MKSEEDSSFSERSDSSENNEVSVISVVSQAAAAGGDGLIETARQLFENNQFEPAKDIFKAIIQLKPSCQAFRYLGDSYVALGKYSKAFKTYKQALMITPDAKNCEELGNLGYIYYYLDDLSLAIKQFEAALEIKSGAKILFYLGKSHQRLGSYNGASSYIYKAINQYSFYIIRTISVYYCSRKSGKYTFTFFC